MPLEPTTDPAGPTGQTILPGLCPIPSQNTETAHAGNDSVKDAEILQASIKARSVAQIVVAVVAAIGLVYLLKIVLVTTLLSILLAFILEPFVSRLARIGIPRSVGALLAVALLVGLAGGLTYFSITGLSISRPNCPNIPKRYIPPWRTCGNRPEDSRRVRGLSSLLPTRASHRLRLRFERPQVCHA